MEMATNKTPLSLKKEKKVWLEMVLTVGVRS